MSMRSWLFTSESVSEGHPDKVSDRISDGVVDLYLGADAGSRVACETLCTTNRIIVAGEDITGYSEDALARWRTRAIGYIFQQFNLLPYLSVLDNTMAPCRFSPPRARVAIERSGSLQAAAEFWLGGMGLPASDWLRPARDLSVGQQQRVAAARALIGAPALVIADEPTSALDDDRRNAFVELLLSSCRATRSALVFVSHDRRIAERFDRQLGLPDVNQVQADGTGKPLAPDGEAP